MAGEKRARRHSAAYERVCVRPDGYGIWAEDGGRLPFFFELDRGTEALDRLAGKLDGYAQAEEAAQQPTWILVSLPSEQREQHARHAMHRSGVPDVPVATTHRRLPATNHPDQAVWWPLHDPGAHQGRVRLVDLAAVPFPAGSLHHAGAIRRAHAQEAARTAARKAEHQRWLAERQALEEAAARPAAALVWEQPSATCYAVTVGGETRDLLVTGLLERGWQLLLGNPQVATLAPLPGWWLDVDGDEVTLHAHDRRQPLLQAAVPPLPGWRQAVEAEHRCALVTGTGLGLSRGGAGLLPAIRAARVVAASVVVLLVLAVLAAGCAAVGGGKAAQPARPGRGRRPPAAASPRRRR